MVVVYLFLGSLRRTLIIGSAIPIAVLITSILIAALIAAFGLTFNIMTLGGLALGIGMLENSTIVMLENLYRHQHQGNPRGGPQTRRVRKWWVPSSPLYLHQSGGSASLLVRRRADRTAVLRAHFYHLRHHLGGRIVSAGKPAPTGLQLRYADLIDTPATPPRSCFRADL